MSSIRIHKQPIGDMFYAVYYPSFHDYRVRVVVYRISPYGDNFDFNRYGEMLD